MTRERVYLFDTTLRDGAQTNGVDFTAHDKKVVAGMLDDLGLDYVEGGYPGANPTDTEFFATDPKLERATFTAFGMTRRPGRSASNLVCRRSAISLGGLHAAASSRSHARPAVSSR